MKKLNKTAAIIAAAIITLTNTTAVFAETAGLTETAYVQTEQTTELTAETAAEEILQLVNEKRAAAGLAPLTLDPDLSYAAQLKAQDMIDFDYFDHESPNYGTCDKMLDFLGIGYKAGGENLAKNQKTSEDVVNKWMLSEHHKENILNENFGKLGVGYINANGTIYWVQIFTN